MVELRQVLTLFSKGLGELNGDGWVYRTANVQRDD